MPAIYGLLYPEYCRARLNEMRKQLLLLPQWTTISWDHGDDASPTMKVIAAGYDVESCRGQAELKFSEPGGSACEP
jgi:hypothetical protein